MQRAGAIEDRLEPHASGTQPQAEVVVFLAPADEAFVESIHQFKVAPPDAEVASRQPGLGRMAEQGVPPGLAKPASQEPPLAGGRERGEIDARQSAGHEHGTGRFRQAGTVAEVGHARPPAGEIRRHVVARQDAVAVEKQQIIAGGQPCTLVSYPGQAEPSVRLAREVHGQARRGGEGGRHVGRLVA